MVTVEVGCRFLGSEVLPTARDPIPVGPGEHYEVFLRRGVVTEVSLTEFDSSCLVSVGVTCGVRPATVDPFLVVIDPTVECRCRV